MDNYTFVTLKINNINGEVEVMSTKTISRKSSMKDIFEVYKHLNVSTKSNKNTNSYERFSKYDYNQKSSLDINTYAKI